MQRQPSPPTLDSTHDQGCVAPLVEAAGGFACKGAERVWPVLRGGLTNGSKSKRAGRRDRGLCQVCREGPVGSKARSAGRLAIGEGEVKKGIVARMVRRRVFSARPRE